MGPTPTPTRTSAMRLSCNFVNGYTIAYHVQYTFTRVHARIPNGHPREARKSARRTSRRTSRRGSSCVSGSWQAERGSVRVGVSPMEFKLYAVHSAASCPRVLQWEGGAMSVGSGEGRLRPGSDLLIWAHFDLYQ